MTQRTPFRFTFFRAFFGLLLLLAALGGAAQQQSRLYRLRFARNHTELSPAQQQLLAQLADTLQQAANYVVYVNGHADSDADSTYNQQLSLRRSLAVKDFLVGKGLREGAFRVRALGEEQPLVANTTPLQKAQNRRVELLVLFEQAPEEQTINVEETIAANNEPAAPGCTADTTVTLEGGYQLTLSTCDWTKNAPCLRVEKRFTYKFLTKENWLARHLGFRHYKKTVAYEPHYEFYVVSCTDSCFGKPVKLSIPQYQAPGLNTEAAFEQKRNASGGNAGLRFRKAKHGDSAYYVARIYCPGILHCGFDPRCTHPVTLVTRRGIEILSYSYKLRSRTSYFDSLVTATPAGARSLTDNYNHLFFEQLQLRYRGDTVTLRFLPVDAFPHGWRKIKTKASPFSERSYFLFIPYRKKNWCGHYYRYKLRPKVLRYYQHFDFGKLPVEQ